MNRRGSLKTAVGAGLAAVAPARSESVAELPMRSLGGTGAPVSVLAFCGGSHFLGRVNGDEKTVTQLILHALELGIHYFDTAASYTFKPSLQHLRT